MKAFRGEEPKGLGISRGKTDWKTEVIAVGSSKKVNKDQRSLEALDWACRLIQEGELVAFPTETVYGLGANGLDGRACTKIFEAKGRPMDNPLILHIYDVAQVEELAEEIIPRAKKLMEDLWPGPMTLVFKKKPQVPKEVTAGGDTVGIRMPVHPVARAFLKKCDLPIAAPSANLSGRPSPTNAQDVYQDMNGRLPLILDGGLCSIGIESTVIDLTREPAIILRPGFYTPEDLTPYLPGVRLDQGLLEEGQIPRSPGQKYKHYAPQARMSVFLGPKEIVEKRLVKEYLQRKSQGRIGLLLFEDSIEPVKRAIEEVTGRSPFILSQGKTDDLLYMSQMLFTHLRQFDREKMEEILAMGVESKGYGVSIMNRMKKAAGGRIIALSPSTREKDF